MRFSLKTLLGLVTAAAITCCCMLYAKPVLADVYYSIIIASVVLALVCASQLRGSQQAFWIGYLMVAGAYTWLALGRSEIDTRLSVTLTGSSTIVTANDPELVTTSLLSIGYDLFCLSDKTTTPRSGNISLRRAGTPFGYNTKADLLAQTYVYRKMDPNYVAFVSIGHASFGMVLGWLGDCLARKLHEIARKKNLLNSSAA